MSKIYLSIIVPFYNEVSNLSVLNKELLRVIAAIKSKCEIIYVDDASTDGSVDSLVKDIKNNGNKKIDIKLISLRRNFGQTAAISAGIDCANGEIVAILDADLQNDPADLPVMIGKLETGFDAVVGWRKNRQDGNSRVLLSKVANWLIRTIFKTPFHDLGCSLKVIRRNFLKDTRFYGESHRLISVLLFWKGAAVEEVIVKHRKRLAGQSKYGYSRIIKLILDLVTSKFLSAYGTKPAYVFGTFGILSIFVGIPLMGMVLYDKLYQSVYVHRNPLFLIASFLILLGIQFLLMGLLAELIVRTYFETQKKTTYEIKNTKVY
ncbi:MAG: glycosyltransferase family 2 protein [Actinobacteria bacterium]|nr:glycosyltransferase family 2 protein [Actinomycetota bacterium]